MNSNYHNHINVALFSSSISYGGGEKVSREITNISNSDISTSLVIIDNDLHDISLVSSPVVSLSAHTYNKTHVLPPGVKQIVRFIIICLSYRNYLKKNDISVSIDRGMELSIINYMSCIGIDTIAVSTKHSIYHLNPLTQKRWGRLLSALYVYLYLFSLKHVGRVIAVSNGVSSVLVESGIPNEKIDLIYNPLDIENIQKQSHEAVHEDIFYINAPILITVGRLEYIKAQWHLIRVFREVRKVTPCKLVICGDGSLRDYLDSLVERWNLKGDVLFTGEVKNPYKYLVHSTLFVLTSLSEALPYAILESMACSCPVVATDCDGVRELCGDNQYGIVSSPITDDKYDNQYSLDNSECDLRNNILLLLNDSALRERYVSAGLKRASEFDKEIAYTKYRELIRSICKTH